MKESISYSFLLNIIILFITVCAAIIMGIFSYYKAFRANSIITETIEKYEGYNCIAKEEIARKLGGIGYNTPFNVKCKNSDGNCETDNAENGNYKVTSYNLDFDKIFKMIFELQNIFYNIRYSTDPYVFIELILLKYIENKTHEPMGGSVLQAEEFDLSILTTLGLNVSEKNWRL